MIGLVLLVLLGLGLYLYRCISYKLSYWARQGIRGPPPSFYYGNSAELHKLDYNGALQLREWTKEFGPVYGIFEGTNRVLVFSDIEMLHDVYYRQFECFEGKKLLHLASDEDGTDDRVHMAEAVGRRWVRLRSSASPLFTAASLRRVLPIVSDSVSHMVSLLRGVAGESINIHEFLQEFTFDVICRLVVGQRESRQFHNPLSEQLRAIFVRDLNVWYLDLNLAFPALSPYLRRLFNTLAAKFENPIGLVIKEMEKEVDERIRRREKEEMEEDEVDFIHQFMHLQAEELEDVEGKRGRKLTRDEIIAQCFLFVMAGFDTTASTIGFVLHVMGTHREVQEKAREEILALGLSEWDYDSLHKLQYLDAVIRETLRLFPLGANTIGRKCTKETTVGGVKIERGTYLQPDVFTLHFDPLLWGDDVGEFKPDRWLEGRVPQRAWLAFGAGPRMCIGVRLAMMETRLALVAILTQFQVSVAESEAKLSFLGSTTFSPARVLVQLTPCNK